MRIRCAWHEKYFGKELIIGEKHPEQEGTTDGICSECLAIFEKEIESKLVSATNQKGDNSEKTDSK